MNVLLIGSGGREHALAWKLRSSPLLKKLYCAPGNGGIGDIAECVSIPVGDHTSVMRFCKDNAIDFVVIGPEAPLVAGLVDDLATTGIKCFGPKQAAAQLEGSKGYTKDLAREYSIPTAAYGRFSDAAAARAYLDTQQAPVVVKADGLAAGKGVIVAETEEQALAAIDEMFGGAFGAAGAEVVIEEFMTGEEASFFVLCDGETALPIGTAQDHKRVGEGDTGPNTGGMGAYSPAPVMTERVTARALEEIVQPVLSEMVRRGTPYSGVLFVGLMIEHGAPRLVEFNVRFGDPECQALMMRLGGQALDLMQATAEGRLEEMTVNWAEDHSLCVVMAARGYPGEHEKGSVIGGIEDCPEDSFHQVFHAGTARRDGRFVANGGRVLGVTARGASLREAADRAYGMVDRIDWAQGFCRRDIGWRAL